MLQNGEIVWETDKIGDKPVPYDREIHQLFYGFQELGQNLVWKPMDDDPSLFLNFYEKASNYNKTVRVLTRYGTIFLYEMYRRSIKINIGL